MVYNNTMNYKLPAGVKKVLDKFQQNKFQIYIVGGAVRDMLMGKKVLDFDFTTNATPQQILQIFPDGFYDNKFGTVGVVIDKDLKPFEITTYRSESEYKDARHPEKVIWGKTLEEDLQRRDFTINAMALGNDLIDPYNGQEDLKNKIIRTVGNPDTRFSEDALRMMRAIRIAAELGFTIEKNTLSAIAKNWQLLYKISFERIRDELFKILKSPYPKDGIKLLFTTNLLQVIIPELLTTQGIKQAGHHTEDVWNHSLNSLANSISPDPVVRLATLLHDIGKPRAYRNKNGKITFYGHEVVSYKLAQVIGQRLRLSRKDKEKLLILVRQHMFVYNPNMTDAAIRRFIRKVGEQNINDMINLRIADRLGSGSKATSWRLQEFQQRIGQVLYTPMEVKDLKVNGHDIMKILGLKPGPEVGKILNNLFEEILEDASKNNREYLLKKIISFSSTLKVASLQKGKNKSRK